MVEVKVTGTGSLPVYAHEDDSGFDIRALESGYIFPNEFKAVATGLFVEIPPGYEIQIRSRSGLAFKDQVFVLNSPGTIDAGYRGEIKLLMFNLGKTRFDYVAGAKLAQGVLAKVERAVLVRKEELTETDRGVGGFGSTGV